MGSGGDCSEAYNYEISVTLTATPDSSIGTVFNNWSGDCSGTSTTCTLTMNGDKSVKANFVCPAYDTDGTDKSIKGTCYDGYYSRSLGGCDR